MTNSQDPFTVAVIKYRCVVGHNSRTINQTVSFSSESTVVSAFVTGGMLNHTTGFSLEISSLYQYYGHQAYIKRLKNMLL